MAHSACCNSSAIADELGNVSSEACGWLCEIRGSNMSRVVYKALTERGQAAQQRAVVLGRGQHQCGHELADEPRLDVHALVAHHDVHHLRQIGAVHLRGKGNGKGQGYTTNPAAFSTKGKRANGDGKGQRSSANPAAFSRVTRGQWQWQGPEVHHQSRSIPQGGRRGPKLRG